MFSIWLEAGETIQLLLACQFWPFKNVISFAWGYYEWIESFASIADGAWSLHVPIISL